MTPRSRAALTLVVSALLGEASGCAGSRPPASSPAVPWLGKAKMSIIGNNYAAGNRAISRRNWQGASEAFFQVFAANPRLVVDYTSSARQLVDGLDGYMDSRDPGLSNNRVSAVRDALIKAIETAATGETIWTREELRRVSGALATRTERAVVVITPPDFRVGCHARP